MKRILAKVTCNGEYQVVYDNTQEVNPYRVYHICNYFSEHGVKRSKKQVQRYQDYGSAIFYIAEMVRRAVQ